MKKVQNRLNLTKFLDTVDSTGIITWSKLGWHIQADYCVLGHFIGIITTKGYYYSIGGVSRRY